MRQRSLSCHRVMTERIGRSRTGVGCVRARDIHLSKGPQLGWTLMTQEDQ